MALTLAALHSVQPATVGLAGFGAPSGYNRRQVWRWGQQYERSAAATGKPAMPEMLQLHAWLQAHVPASDGDASATRITHGDYRWGRDLGASGMPPWKGRPFPTLPPYHIHLLQARQPDLCC